MPPPTSQPGTTAPSAGRRIAFHLGKTIYLASEDAKSKTPMHVNGTNYALSPDGRAVAAIEDGKLMVASVGQHLLASSPATPGLTAEAIAPVWLPDSSAVLFVRSDKDGTAHIWILNRVTGAASEFAEGAGVAVAPDSQTVAIVPTGDATTPTISVSRLSGGSGTTFQVPSGEPVAVAMGRDRVFVSTVSAAGSSAIWSVTYDGKKKVKLVGNSPAVNASVTYGELMLSPDGKKLLFAADGDDGYSRLWIVPTAGGTPTAISRRRDGYALGWSRDGKGVIFIEGNAFQGQTTSLWLSDLTGRRRTKLVEGATQ
jgi:Tol biopolymer transport system component